MNTNIDAATVAGLLEQFGRDAEGALRGLEQIYADGILFQDPLQRLEGREAFMAMNRKLVRRSRVLRFDVHEKRDAGDHLFLTWTMDYALKLGPAMRFNGISHLIVSEGKIAYHRDYWDLLSGAMQAVPGLGKVYSALVAKLA